MLLGEQAIERFFLFQFFFSSFPYERYPVSEQKVPKSRVFPQGRNLELDVGDP
jgi:hypothetical protein